MTVAEVDPSLTSRQLVGAETGTSTDSGSDSLDSAVSRSAQHVRFVARASVTRVMTIVPFPRWSLIPIAVCCVVAVAGLAGIKPLLGAAGLFAVLLALWLAQRPVLLALVAVTVVPVSSGLRRGLPIPGLRLSELLTVFAAVVVMGLASKSLPGPRWGGFDVAALGYCVGSFGFGLLATSVHQVPMSSDDYQTVIGPIQFFLLYRMAAAAFPTQSLRRVAMRALLLASVPVSLLAILQQVGPSIFQTISLYITGTSVFDTEGFDPVRRATSVFPIWHALAGYLIVVMLLAVSLLLRRDTFVLPTVGLVAVLGAAFGAMVLTLTATPVIGLVIGVIILGSLFKRLAFVLTVMVLGSVVVLVAFFPLVSARIADQSTPTAATPTAGNSIIPQTVLYRVDVWVQEYLPAMRGSWSTGYGPAAPPNVSWKHTESGYLTLLLRGGVGYLAIAAALVYLSWRRGRQLLRQARAPSEAGLAAAAMALAVVIAVMNLAFPYFTASGMPQPLWVVWGLLAAAVGQTVRETHFEQPAEVSL